MEEKKTPQEIVDTPQTQATTAVEQTEQKSDPTVAESAATPKQPRKASFKYTVVAVVLVIIALLAVLFRLESEGRVGTSIFSGVIAWQESRAPLAVVNGVEITAEDLSGTADQLAQSAVLQGADPNDPAVQREIQAQSLQLLIRTELLMQAAAAANIEVTAEEIAQRRQQIEDEAGGADLLAERMEEFSITDEALQSDIESELTIQKLLEQSIDQEALEVTSEEAQEVYDQAVEAGAEVPPFAEVEAQILAQLSQTKETELIDAYLSELQAAADIEIKE